ncbi:MAG: baseplate J/gp47 family protein, partial [Bacillota bacterium]
MQEQETKGSRISLLQLVSIIIGGLVALVLGWLYFLYPTVTVEVSPVVEKREEQLVIEAALAGEQIDREHKLLPLHEFEVTLTDEMVIETTGVELVGTSRARGRVRFINENKEAVNIAAGTRLISDSEVIYETTGDLEIPALKVDYLMEVPVGMKAGQKEIEVIAVKPGTVGNTATGNLRQLVEPKDRVYVINPEPIIGGEDHHQSLVTEADYQRARKELEEKLQNRLLQKIYQELGGNFRIINEKIDCSEIDYSFDREIGEAVGEVLATGTLVASGYLIRNSELGRLVARIYREQLSEGYNLLDTGITIREVTLEEKFPGVYNVLLNLKAPVYPDIIPVNLARELAGKNREHARELLTEHQDIATYSIGGEGGAL